MSIHSGRTFPGRRLLGLFTLLACTKNALGQPNSLPYFSTDAPADGAKFYSFPGTTFSLTIYAMDADANGTANGNIKTDGSELIDSAETGSGIEVGSNPYPTTIPQWIGAPHKVSITRMNMLTNRTMIQYSFTDISVSDFKLIPNPYREVCFVLKDDSGTTEQIWNRRCYQIYVQLAPEFTPGCVMGTMPTQPSTLALFVEDCPRLAMQTHNVVAVGQEFEGNIYFQDYNRDGSLACSECDQVPIPIFFCAQCALLTMLPVRY